ncbi:2,3-dihydro-2,3-dihydroxybenzoate dehydrogenase [Salinifilum ghardaiensis]
MDDTGIAGTVALVTGAAQGIGAAVVRALAQRGATVAAVDRNAEGLAAAGSAARDRGCAVRDYPADVTDSAAVAALTARVERECGSLDTLVNVAGVMRAGRVRDFTDADWEHVFAVNTDGVFHTCRAVADRMVPRQRGCIVTVGSNAAGVPRHGMAAYAASKAAAAQFTKSLGLELAEDGIRCNVVSPGPTDTAMQRSLWTDEGGARRVIAGSPETYKIGIPLGRLAAPDNVADAVVFLVSRYAEHITLQDLYVDGGTTPRA